MSKALTQEINELVTFKNSQGLSARGTLLKLSQSFIVFEVYNPYSIIQLSESLSEMKILRAGKEIYNGKAVVTGIVNTGILLVVSASLSDSSWKNTVDLSSRDEFQQEISHIINNFERQQEVDVDFKMSILSIRSFLYDLKNWIDRLEPAFEQMRVNVNEKFIRDNFALLFEKLTDLFRKSSELISLVPKEKISLYKRFAQDHLYSYLMSSPFPYRSLSKPLGFAGDYMMMHMIQRDSAEGPSLYAKFINVFYAYIPLSRSVNNRTTNLLRLIKEGVKKAENENREFHSLSIGCGPALEVKKFIASENPKVKCNFKLLDFNQETLDFAKSEAEKVKKSNFSEVTTVLDSVHNLLKHKFRNNPKEQKYDLVYCSGLFDYLSDKVCSRLTKIFCEMLKPGGKVLVTNMHVNDVDRHIVEALLEWYLIYRDESNMANFATGIGEQKLYTDETGVNLCLEITKN